MNSPYPRDLLGYGRNPPDPRWPLGARVAVQFVLNYEEGGENSILHGDAASEAFLSDVLGAQPWPGQRHMNVESMYEYGSRAGFWRVWRMFYERRLPLTVFGVATALEKNAETVAAMREADWEIASHGLKWIDYRNVPEAEERAHMREAIRVPHASDRRAAARLVHRPRLGKLARSSSWRRAASSIRRTPMPTTCPTGSRGPKGPHLVIPYSLDANDMRFTNAAGLFRQRRVLRLSARRLRRPLCRGGTSAPKMMSIGLHCRLVGRPGRAMALEAVP